MVLRNGAKSGVGRCFLRILLVAAFGCTAHVAGAQTDAEPDDELAKSIVEKADRVRFPAEAFEASVAISSTGANGPADARQYRILAKGHDNTIVMVTEP